MASIASRSMAMPCMAPAQPRARSLSVSCKIGQRGGITRPGRVLLAPCRQRGLRTPAPVCSAGVAHPGEEASKGEQGAEGFSVHMSVPGTTMAKGGGGGGRDFGSGGSLGAVMERSKLSFVMPTPPQSAPKLDDSGSGGDNGKNLHNGGGGGGGDDDDDDDYFGEGDDEGGDGSGGGGGESAFFRAALPELFDRLSITAVLQEWHKTILDLPLFIRRAVEMGLFSSAQLVRFVSVDVRPGLTRSATRALPPAWAREFVGRLMADPGFCQKLVMEQAMAAGFSVLHEWRTRGERFRDELDLVAINTLGMMAAVGAAVWVTAPSRAYGAVHKFPWQQMLAELPHCVFDASGPLRQYTTGARAAGWFATAAQLSAVGALAGAATSAAGTAAVELRRRRTGDADWTPSVAVPELGRSSGGLAAFFAVNANTRYQLLGGMDRYLFGHARYLWTYFMFSGAARLGAQYAGELSRPAWQGLATAPASRRVRRVVRRKKPAASVMTAAGRASTAATSSAAAPAGAAVAAPPLVAGAAAVAAAAAQEPTQLAEASGADALGMAAQAQAGSSAAAVGLGEHAETTAQQAAEHALPSASAADAGVEAAPGPSHAAAAEAETALLGAEGGAMAHPDDLQQLVEAQTQQRQSLERSLSLSDSAMGSALRDAVGGVA